MGTLPETARGRPAKDGLHNTSPSDTIPDVLGLVLGKLDGVRQQAGYHMARCPVPEHEDREASLSVKQGTKQPVLLNCFAGCALDAILGAIGLTRADISRPGGREEPAGEWMPRGRRAIAVYDYTDGNGDLLFQVLRSPDKKFSQRRPDPSARKGWRWNLDGVRRVPYRLPKLIEAVNADQLVYIVEGEKDVHAVERSGAVATCNPGGEGAGWRAEYDGYFVGAQVVIVADKDEPGRKHAAKVASHLRKVARSVAVVEAVQGKDAADHLEAGLGLDDFQPATLPPSKSATSATSATAKSSPTSEAGKRVADSEPVALTTATWDGDLGELLNDVHKFLGRFVAYPSKHAQVAHALWIAHTHAMGAWDSTPRIAFLSPEPGSGKTRALEVSELLVPRPVEAVNTTPAYLFRKVSDPAGPPTILYDEIDTLFGPKAKDNEEIRGMLNAGHRRGAQAGRCVVRGKIVETEELPAYCAVALAGLGSLPDTLLTRAVVVRMKRRTPGETIEPFRRRMHLADGHAIRDKLALWATSATAAGIGDKWPEMPAGIADRAADVWECLLMIADAAGGDWPERARVAAVALVADSRGGSGASLGIRLLGDIKKVWNGTGSMHTDALLDQLNGLDEAPWGDLKGKPLDPRRLSRFLHEYDVHPADVRADVVTKVNGQVVTEEKVRKGYKRDELHDAWQRYLPSAPACTICGEPLAQALIDAGLTDHGETT